MNSAHKYIDPNWLTWFIGFTEGDGGLHCYKYSKSCLFGLTQKEEPILQEIQSVLGFGKVYFDLSANAYRYRVTTNSENLKLAILFNGNFATTFAFDCPLVYNQPLLLTYQRQESGRYKSKG
jgi:hypothetical protein